MESRSKNLKNNIIKSFILKVLGVGISFLTLPLTVHYLTEIEYGIWVTLFAVMNWVNMMDVGIGLGIRNKLTEAVSLNNRDDIKIYVSTGIAAMSVLGAVFLVVFFTGTQFIDMQNFFNTSTLSSEELYWVTLWTGVFVIAGFSISIINQFYYAYQQPSTTGSINLLNGVLMLGFIYLLTLQTDHKLLYFVFAVGIASILSKGIYIVLFFREHYEAMPGIKYIVWDRLKGISSLGIKFFVIQICCIFGFSFSNVLITQLLGPEYVRTYDVIFKIFSFSVMIQNLALSSLWSAYTDAYVKKDYGWIKSVFKKTCYGTTVIAIGVVSVIFIIDDLVYLWLHMRFEYNILLVYFIALYHILVMYVYVDCMLLNGLSKIDVQMYTWIVAAIVIFPFSWFYIKVIGMGTEGVVLSMVMSMIILLVALSIDVGMILKKILLSEEDII